MESRSEVSPQTIGFLVVPGLALMSYASAIEPLRAANLFAGRELYRWIHITHKEPVVPASCGATLPCTAKVGDDLDLDLLLVCAGGNPAQFTHRPTLAWLRRLAQRGLRIGGVSGGPFILARAGIMGGHRMTIHWEHAQAFAEEFPDLLLTRARYVIDRNRVTCAGGVAPLDMMHALIAERHGAALATRTSDWFLHTEIRPGGGPQRASIGERYGIHRRDLIAALELMQDHLSEPLGRGAVARRIGLSTRQLDRLFARHLGKSFTDHYRSQRLEAAGELLRHSALTITEIAIACGFANASHFSTCYKAETGMSPRAERK
ncbi:GlxA family transcriptional regulator [Nordella sp. HKS 07]|uniref:GlxA family transcriptional regulator n=1 Tax=Nordella sp. HKS 07 TaxID=2712222 RepID=UPI0013E1D78C|nr:GlxA family transcriptional regulator [Nordella sp. HKS 07]QIG47512.1 GlxA family transcriptional regulator [Nordella sp. HKS 07]